MRGNPTSITKTRHLTDDSRIFNHIVHHYEDHPQHLEKMNNLFSPFISAYRKSYNVQHVIIRLLKNRGKF